MKDTRNKHDKEAFSTRKAHSKPAPQGRPWAERPRTWSVAGIVGLVVLGLVSLVVVVLAGLSLWLTPERLSGLASEGAEKYLNADIRTGPIRFTIWSSFPHLHIEIDSISIYSRNFDSTPPSDMAKLPANARFLASASRLSGGINVLRLITGDISLRDITIEDPSINLVALNDSLTNYDIIRSRDDSPVDIPRITATSVTLLRPRSITYFSAASASSATISLSRASIRRLPHSRNNYNMTFSGKTSITTRGMRILDKFPFSLSGHVGLGFKPFSLKFRDYRIALGNVKGKMNLSIKLGENVSISNFNYTITSADLMKLVQYLPSAYIPLTERINADLQVNMSGRLLKPYRYSPSRLPTFAVDFTVDRGTLGYTLKDNSSYSLHDILLNATFTFDGDNPMLSRFDIPELSLKGPGSSIGLSASITHLMSDPAVEANVALQADLATLGQNIRGLKSLRLHGGLTSRATLNFSLGSISSPEVKDIQLRGTARLDDYSVFDPPADFELRGDLLQLSFGGNARTLPAFNLNDALLTFNGKGGALTYTGHNQTARADGITLSGDFKGQNIAPSCPLNVCLQARSASLKMPGALYTRIDGISAKAALTGLKGRPSLAVDAKTGGIAFDSRVDTLSTRIKSLEARALISDFSSNPSVTLKARTAGIAFQNPGNDISLGATAIGASLVRAKIRRQAPTPYPAPADSLLLRRLGHTPEWLTIHAPEWLRQVISLYDYSLALSTSGGRISTDLYPADNRLGKVVLNLDNDRLDLKDFNIDSNGNRLSLSASLENLADIIASDVPVEFPMTLDARLGRLNINNIANDIDKGQKKRTGRSFIDPMPETITPSHSDSLALLLPRNIRGNIRIAIDETVYTNLHLFNLRTGIHLADGVADIDSLGIDSDFGRALLRLTYSSSDIERMNMKASLAIQELNIVKFFNNFHTLLLMMPQMRNLSGFISADLNGSLPLFPTMFIDVPGISADLLVEGRRLQVRQTPFIRRITRMMLIRTADDIHIANMNVHARVYDNLLELFPFDFRFDRYRLTMNGLNNFNGDLCYHIGVMKSPLPFPFGIRIGGLFHHPTLRFASPYYHPADARQVTDRVQGEYSFNLTRELKVFMRAFMRSAVKAANDPSYSL